MLQEMVRPSYSLALTMSTRTNATISPDHAASDPPDPTADTVPSSSHAKRRGQEEADTPGDGTGTGGPAAKVARLASAEEKTKEQAGDETPESPPLTTEMIMRLLKDLWSDDKCVIFSALTKIIDIGTSDDPPYENEVKMRVLGVHTAVFQVLHKHIGCRQIQEQGMHALGNLCMLFPTQKLLGEIGCVEVILAMMGKYQGSLTVQGFGCYVIGKLIHRMKGNAERVEKSGGIVLVIAAMKAHPNCQVLQGICCILLSCMSEWEKYRPLIVAAGGASAVVFVVEKYRGNDPEELRKHAYKAMQLLFKE
jgi:hypothetical protein